MKTVVGLSTVSAAGAVIMAVAHLGIRIPVVSALGPGGNDAVPPAVIAFAVGACLHALVAGALFRGRSWSWPLGLVVNAVTLLGAAVPYRGIGSLVGIVVAGATLALLLSPPVRRALVPNG